MLEAATRSASTGSASRMVATCGWSRTRGVIESAVFPGRRLAVAKLLAGDNAGVRAEPEPQQDAG